MSSVKFLGLVAALALAVQALDNGLARTPPMGWMDWQRFRCNIDCDNDPENCISERLIKEIADRMAADGYRDAGYKIVSIDDCWPLKDRDANGRLVADPKRFPSGIKALSAYLHSKGLLMGIYEDFGTHTCAGYPGSEYFLQTDAQTFADWDVDFLKLDGCYSNPDQMDDAYPAMGMWLNKTGRPIVYSCSWPAYQEGSSVKPNYKAVSLGCNMARNYNDVQDSWESVTGIIEFYGQNAEDFASVAGPGFWNDPDEPNYVKIAQTCNLWRNAGDVQDSWDSVAGILGFYGDDHTNFTAVAGPGNWNDPDELIIGDYGLSWEQQKVQMGMWAIMASPLFMSVDLRTINPQSRALLLNRNVLAINQDPMGIQGRRIVKDGNTQIWTRPISPKGTYAFAYLNFGTGGTPSAISTQLSKIGLTSAGGYNITEVFEGKSMGMFKPSDVFTAKVFPTSIFLGKAVPLNQRYKLSNTI